MNSLSCEETRDLAPAYALDSLNPATTAAVRRHLADHPGAHPEFAEFAEVAPALAYLVDPVKPPAALKVRLLAVAAVTPPAAPRPEPAEIAIVPAPRRSGSRVDGFGRGRGAPDSRRAAALRWILAAAAVVAIVTLGARDLALQQDVEGLPIRRIGGGEFLGELRQACFQLAQDGFLGVSEFFVTAVVASIVNEYSGGGKVVLRRCGMLGNILGFVPISLHSNNRPAQYLY